MDQSNQMSEVDAQVEDALEALADEARDVMYDVIEGVLKINEVPRRLLLDDMWMNDLFMAMTTKRYGRALSPSTMCKILSIRVMQYDDRRQ